MRLACLVCITAIVSCSRAPEDATADAPTAPTPSAPSSDLVPADDCAALFAPPPGATKLCDEHVLTEGSEIHWQSYAHADDRYALWPSYQERARKCGAGTISKPPMLEVVKDDRRLELFDAAGGGFPTCTVAPAADRKTVVLVSEKHDRPK